MAEHSIAVSRPLVGVVAITCLVIAAVIACVDELSNLWCGAFIRVGLLMGALWLAMPSRTREAAWANISPSMLIAAVVGVFLVVRWPLTFLPLLIGLITLGAFLRPRSRTPRARQQRGNPRSQTPTSSIPPRLNEPE